MSYSSQFSLCCNAQTWYRPPPLLLLISSSVTRVVGASIQAILMACFRSVVWESMNTNRELREVVKHLISPLSTINSEYSQRKDQFDLHPSDYDPSKAAISSSTSSTSHHQHQQLLTQEEEQLEKDLILMTYLPSHIISTCLRNLCTNDEIEMMLIHKLDEFFHVILNKNVHLVATLSPTKEMKSKGLNSMIHEVSGGKDVLGLKSRYDLLMRPKSLTDVRVSDLIEFFVSNHTSSTSSNHHSHAMNQNECTKIIISEQRKLSKKLNKYLYKTREKERL